MVKGPKQNYVSLLNGLKTNFKVQIDLALIYLGSMALLALCAPPPLFSGVMEPVLHICENLFFGAF